MNWIWYFAFTFFVLIVSLLMTFATKFVSSQTVMFVGIAAIIVLLIDVRR